MLPRLPLVFVALAAGGWKSALSSRLPSLEHDTTARPKLSRIRTRASEEYDAAAGDHHNYPMAMPGRFRAGVDRWPRPLI